MKPQTEDKFNDLRHKVLRPQQKLSLFANWMRRDSARSCRKAAIPARLASYLSDVWDCSRSRESWTWLKRRQHKINLIVKRPLRINNFHCISLASPHTWLPCWARGGGEFNLWFPIKFISCANAGLSPNINNQIVILCNCLVASTVMQWALGKNASNANEKFQLKIS